MESYNRQIPTITTYHDALHFAWVIIDREARKLEESDVHGQNLACNHRKVIEVMSALYYVDPSDITRINNKD